MRPITRQHRQIERDALPQMRVRLVELEQRMTALSATACRTGSDADQRAAAGALAQYNSLLFRIQRLSA